MKTKLILASQSIGRKQLLETLQVPFETIPSFIDEDKITSVTPMETVLLRAKLKGEDVAGKVMGKQQDQDVLIISADSGAIIDNQLIGKPAHEKEAYEIFALLSGRTHKFISATYIIRLSAGKSEIILNDIETSFVTFREMTKEDIKLYLKITQYTKFAGGYALYSAQNFITKIEGSLSNVIGLPLEKVIPILKAHKLL